MQFAVSLERFIVKKTSVIVEAENEPEAKSIASALVGADEVNLDFNETLLEQNTDNVEKVDQ